MSNFNNSQQQPKRRAYRDAFPSGKAVQSQTLPSQMLEQLEEDVSKMMEMLQKLRSRVTKDDLTGLLRRNEFFRRLEGMVEPRSGDVSVVILDIDNFKSINDLEGHVVGDHVLQRVGKVIARCTRAGAQVGRFGGEEFVIAVCASPERTRVLAEAIRRQIQREVNVTVSVGVATARIADWEVRKMVGMADQALYQAKHAGKNRVCLAA
ncbi:MAG TPA: GGDEF domain-containing protein [Bdellovibrionota bacterium]|jgi:diguanylate cyclase (GGDEF)-like protein